MSGTEHVSTAWTGGAVSVFDAVYHDTVFDQRIVHSYRMKLDDKLISVTLATITFHAAGSRTRLVVTEHGVFLNAYKDNGSR